MYHKAKCSFAQKSVECLGQRVQAEGIIPTSEKLKATTDAKTSGDVKQLRSYLELIYYYAKFVPRVFIVLRPLHQLLKKERKWKSKCSKNVTRP